MPIPELVPVIRTDAMDGLLRDLLPPRHGRATRHRASGFRAFELFCNMGRGRRTARAASEPDTVCHFLSGAPIRAPTSAPAAVAPIAMTAEPPARCPARRSGAEARRAQGAEFQPGACPGRLPNGAPRRHQRRSVAQAEVANQTR